MQLYLVGVREVVHAIETVYVDAQMSPLRNLAMYFVGETASSVWPRSEAILSTGSSPRLRINALNIKLQCSDSDS
jgi:hypothetical protein